MNKLLFFCIASAILVFSIITINIAPIINTSVGSGWIYQSCKYYADKYNYDKDDTFPTQEIKDETLETDKKNRDRCNRKQAMVGLEYAALNINLFFGFICALLGLFHYLNLGNLGKIIGLMGLGGGVIGFVLTLVYVIESGLIFNDIDDGTPQIRIDSDGAFLKWKDNKYVCIYYEKDNKDSVLLKYSDYGNKYLNYKKEIKFGTEENNYEYAQCISTLLSPSIHTTITPNNLWDYCKQFEEGNVLNSKYDYKDNTNTKKGECDKIYEYETHTQNNKKIIYEKWLTTIIFSCLIFVFNIGLAIFGFLLFRENNGSSGAVAIK